MLVSSAAITKHPRLAVYNNKFISHHSGGWKPEIVCQHGQVQVRALFWVADCHLLIVSSHGCKRARELSGSLL